MRRPQNKKTPGAAWQPGVISSGKSSGTVMANSIALQAEFRRISVAALLSLHNSEPLS